MSAAYIEKYDFMYHEFGYNPTLESTLVDTLEKMFDDKDGWISWWIYETDYGKNFPEISTSDDIKYVISDGKQLYYILNGEWDKLERNSV